MESMNLFAVAQGSEDSLSRKRRLPSYFLPLEEKRRDAGLKLGNADYEEDGNVQRYNDRRRSSKTNLAGQLCAYHKTIANWEAIRMTSCSYPMSVKEPFETDAIWKSTRGDESSRNVADLTSKLSYGTVVYSGREIYSGGLLNGLHEGNGVYLKSTGDAYVGSWCQNRRHGWGLLIKSQGLRYEGCWVKDTRSGFGLQALPNGFRHAGVYKDNARHGRGILIQANGTIYAGEWERGETTYKELLFQKCNLKKRFKRMSNMRYNKEDGPCSPNNACEDYDDDDDDGSDLTCTDDVADEEETDDDTSQDTDSEAEFNITKKRSDKNKGVDRNDVSPKGQMALRKSSLNRRGRDDNMSFAQKFKCIRNLSQSCCLHRWTVVEVTHLVHCLGLDYEAAQMKLHNIDGKVLLSMSENFDADLQEIEIWDPCIRRFLIVVFELLLKLRFRRILDKSFSESQIENDSLLEQVQIHTKALVLKRRIGEGAYGRVYEGLCLMHSETSQPVQPVGGGTRLDYQLDSVGSPMKRTAMMVGSNAENIQPEDENQYLKKRLNFRNLSSGYLSSSSRAAYASKTSVSSLVAKLWPAAAQKPEKKLRQPLTGTLEDHSKYLLDKEETSGPGSRQRLSTGGSTSFSSSSNTLAAGLSAPLSVPVAIKVFQRARQPTHGRQLGVGGKYHDDAEARLQTQQEASAKDFYTELKVLVNLRHPNLVAFLGATTRPVFSIVTEYVSCGSLFDLLHRHKSSLTLSQITRIARDVACGMSYLHSLDIFHCDLKSSNILLSETGGVKICDFGLAIIVPPAITSKLKRSPSTCKQAASRAMLGCVGTHQWMAPEILRGEAFTSSSDVYSFGVILWEMMTHKVPYQGLPLVHTIAWAGYAAISPSVHPWDLSQRVYQVYSGSFTNRTRNSNPQVSKNLGLPPNDLILGDAEFGMAAALVKILNKCLHPQPSERPPFSELVTHFENCHREARGDLTSDLESFFLGDIA